MQYSPLCWSQNSSHTHTNTHSTIINTTDNIVIYRHRQMVTHDLCAIMSSDKRRAAGTEKHTSDALERTKLIQLTRVACHRESQTAWSAWEASCCTCGAHHREQVYRVDSHMSPHTSLALWHTQVQALVRHDDRATAAGVFVCVWSCRHVWERVVVVCIRVALSTLAGAVAHIWIGLVSIIVEPKRAQAAREPGAAAAAAKL